MYSVITHMHTHTHTHTLTGRGGGCLGLVEPLVDVPVEHTTRRDETGYGGEEAHVHPTQLSQHLLWRCEGVSVGRCVCVCV